MQLPLPITLPTDETFDSFVATNNKEIVALLHTLVCELGDTALIPSRGEGALESLSALRLPLVTLLGAPGVGKSHLIYAFCHQLAQRSISHQYLNLQNHQQWSLDIFDALENIRVICLDNIHAIAGDEEWEEALFDLLNRVAESGDGVIICSSHIGPSHPDFHLPDLCSRLAWGVIYHIATLNDEGRMSVLKIRAEQRGMRLSEQALQFLLHHSDRDLRHLLSILDRLDTRSLQEQKKLSVAMVKRELGL